MSFNAEFEISFGLPSQIIESDLPEIVFSGKSNVGKSSLINKLTNRKSLARTSSMPGKTTTINFYKLQGFRFVDLPGYGYAKRSLKEKERFSNLVEGYFAKNRDIRLVIQLVDMRHPPSKDDMKMINFLCDYSYPFIIVLTKSDKLNKTQRENRLNSLKDELLDFEGITLLPFSTVTTEGVEKLKEIISSTLED
jgi:GTP-binding protein